MAIVSEEIAVNYDDPFIVGMNIVRFRSLLQTEIDGTTRHTLRQLLAEFQATEALREAVVPLS